MKGRKSLVSIIMALSMLLITMAPGMALANENSDTTGITIMSQLSVGETRTLAVYPANATVTWESNNTSIATVNSSGVVTGIGDGMATITATAANGATATYQVFVGIIPTSIVIEIEGLFGNFGWGDAYGDADDILIPNWNPAQAYAFVYPSNASQKVTWHSSNPSAATVDENGLITCGDDYGTDTSYTTITATTVNGLTAEFVLWVGWPI